MKRSVLLVLAAIFFGISVPAAGVYAHEGHVAGAKAEAEAAPKKNEGPTFSRANDQKIAEGDIIFSSTQVVKAGNTSLDTRLYTYLGNTGANLKVKVMRMEMKFSNVPGGPGGPLEDTMIEVPLNSNNKAQLKVSGVDGAEKNLELTVTGDGSITAK